MYRVLLVTGVMWVSSAMLMAQSGCGDCADLKPPTAMAAWNELVAGNKRSLQPAGTSPRRGMCRRTCTAGGQHPFAIVVSCADSRVPPEILFDQGIGDLFVLRVAGNTATREVKGSIEYALEHFEPQPKVLVVLGHESCGAAKAALHPPDHASAELTSIVAPILPAVGGCKDDACLSAVVGRNVSLVVADLKKFAPVAAAQKKGLEVRGAVYKLDSGAVVTVP